jgi:hypothetical protein
MTDGHGGTSAVSQMCHIQLHAHREHEQAHADLAQQFQRTERIFRENHCKRLRRQQSEQ